jgi:hypothetical protein
MAKKKKLTEQERALLAQTLKETPTLKVQGCGKSENKGWSDTPLFETALKDKYQQFDVFNSPSND